MTFWRVALPLLVAASAAAGCGGGVEVHEGPPPGASDGGVPVGPGGGSGTGDVDGADRPSCQPNGLSCRGRSCCAATYVPGGTFDRYNDPAYPATVSAFHLDVFEVTVGRMRAFVGAVEEGWRPPYGSGASPHAAGTGWKPAWGEWAFFDDLRAMLVNEIDPSEKASKYAVWTVQPGPYERVPIALLTWAIAQSFCIWDGGRLPTLVEWRFAAAGGSQQRKYPWGDEPPSPDRALLDYEILGPLESYFIEAGSAPGGAARWGHLDMNGSRTEWVLDGNPAPYAEAPEPVLPCNDCVFPPLKDRPMAVDVSGRVMSQFWVVNENPETDGDVFIEAQVDIWVGFRCVYGHTIVEE